MQKIKNNKDYLYFIQSYKNGAIKIGRSNDPFKRLKQLQTGNQEKLHLVFYIENMGEKEKYLHNYLKEFRINGEWFKYECVGSIPIDIYQLIPFGILDQWCD